MILGLARPLAALQVAEGGEGVERFVLGGVSGPPRPFEQNRLANDYGDSTRMQIYGTNGQTLARKQDATWTTGGEDAGQGDIA